MLSLWSQLKEFNPTCPAAARRQSPTQISIGGLCAITRSTWHWKSEKRLESDQCSHVRKWGLQSPTQHHSALDHGASHSDLCVLPELQVAIRWTGGCKSSEVTADEKFGGGEMVSGQGNVGVLKDTGCSRYYEQITMWTHLHWRKWISIGKTNKPLKKFNCFHDK